MIILMMIILVCCVGSLSSVDITQNIFYISLCFREQNREASSLSEVRTTFVYRANIQPRLDGSKAIIYNK